MRAPSKSCSDCRPKVLKVLIRSGAVRLKDMIDMLCNIMKQVILEMPSSTNTSASKRNGLNLKPHSLIWLKPPPRPTTSFSCIVTSSPGISWYQQEKSEFWTGKEGVSGPQPMTWLPFSSIRTRNCLHMNERRSISTICGFSISTNPGSSNLSGNTSPIWLFRETYRSWAHFHS